MNLINIQNLTFKYDKNTILKDFNLSVQKGEILGVFGKTGSGKSTLIKHLNGILRSNEGSLEILGKKINQNSKNLKELRRKVGVVFQFPEEQLFAENSEKDILFGPTNFGISTEKQKQTLNFLSKKLGLTQEILDSPSEKLSGGEKRRVALASILSSTPKILVLDEPTIGLDYENKSKLKELLIELNQMGVTIIIVSHDLNLIWEILTRVIILESGKKVFDGDRKELIRNRDKFKGRGVYFPDFILELEKRNLLSHNKNKNLTITKEKAIEIILKGGADEK